MQVAGIPCCHGIVITSFKDDGAEDVFNGRSTPWARRTCPTSMWSVAQRKLDQLDSAVSLGDPGTRPGNRLERLSEDRRGQYSIRINNKYCICFEWTNGGLAEVEITDYH